MHIVPRLLTMAIAMAAVACSESEYRDEGHTDGRHIIPVDRADQGGPVDRAEAIAIAMAYLQEVDTSGTEVQVTEESSAWVVTWVYTNRPPAPGAEYAVQIWVNKADGKITKSFAAP